jgi:hypothetical protein
MSLQGKSATFLPNPEMPIPAIGNGGNLLSVVSPSTIPTTVNIRLAYPKDDSIPSASKIKKKQQILSNSTSEHQILGS